MAVHLDSVVRVFQCKIMEHIMSSGGDEELVAKAKSGDRAVRGRLALRCHSALMALIREDLSSKVRDHIEAVDVVQEVYAEIIRRFSGFEGSDYESFRHWALAIARNKVRELHRRFLQAVKRGAGRARQRLPAPLSQTGVSLLSALEAHVTTVSEKAVRGEALESLGAALSLLPDHYREIIELRYLRGLSVEETAQRTGRTKGSVLMIRHRAMRQLADIIRQFPLLTRV